MTLIRFAPHTELSNFSNKLHGIRLFKTNCLYQKNKCRPLIANLYTFLEASDPKRHHVQEGK